MLKIAIIYHGLYGHTEKIAKYIFAGAESVSGVDVELMTAKEAIAKIESLKDYNGMIFGSPTYMGSVSAGLKEFMEVSSKQWMNQDWRHKLAGGFTNGSSLSGDKFNSQVQLVTFAAQHSMLWVPLSVENQSNEEGATTGEGRLLNRIGSNLCPAAQSDNDSPEITPPSGDLETAKLYGKHFAEAVLRWNK